MRAGTVALDETQQIGRGRIVRQRLERFEQTTGQSLRETERLVELDWALGHRRIG